MILPYYAVIKDSFRAAMASWVLYILLILITIVLLLLIPLTYQEQLTTKIYPMDIQTGPFVGRMIEASVKDEVTPAKKVWDRLKKNTQKEIQEISVPLPEDASNREKLSLQRRVNSLPTTIADELNLMIADDSFYDEKTWKGVSMSSEFEELLEQRKAKETPLTVEQEKRLNRIALETAMPRSIQRAAATSLKFYYFMELPAVPMRRTAFKEFVAGYLPWTLDTFVLTIGLLVAIIVTAPILPQMFEPGSLHLLLSKPVSRSMLFLSKFAGGCAFILLCSTYLFVGVFLIAGVRLGIWQYGLLLAIPIYVFVFAIYYTVSSLAAIIWRNTIVAIACAFIFWFFCATLSWTASGVSFANNMVRINDVGIVDGQVTYYNGSDTFVWNGSDWQPVLLTEREAEAIDRSGISASASGRVGLFYDEEHEAMFSIDRKPGFFSREYYSRVGDQQGVLLAQIAALPDIIYAGQDPDGDVIAVSGLAGIARYSGDPLAARKLLEELGDDKEVTDEQMLSTIPFRIVSPPSLSKTPPEKATMDMKTGDMVLYAASQVTVLKADEEGKYEQVGEPHKLPVSEESVLMAATGGLIMLARGNEPILTINAKTMKVRNKIEGESGARPMNIVAGPSGRWFAVLYTNRQVWLYDTKAEIFERAPVYGSGEIGAIGFGGPHTLLVGDRTERVIEYSLGPVEYKRTLQGDGSNFEFVSRWIVMPLYYIAPKPLEFYQPVTYILQGEVSSSGFASEAVRLNPWLPIWSGAWFVAFMLILCCYYIERSEY